MGVASRALAARASDFDAVQFDGAALPTGQPGDAIEQRRFAVTIESDDTNPLTGIYNKVEIVDDPHRTISGGKTADVQHFALRGHGVSASADSGRSSCTNASLVNIFEIGGVDFRIGENVLDHALEMTSPASMTMTRSAIVPEARCDARR